MPLGPAPIEMGRPVRLSFSLPAEYLDISEKATIEFLIESVAGIPRYCWPWVAFSGGLPLSVGIDSSVALDPESFVSILWNAVLEIATSGAGADEDIIAHR